MFQKLILSRGIFIFFAFFMMLMIAGCEKMITFATEIERRFVV